MLGDLVAAGVVETITATGKAGGFEVVVKFGNVERVLGNARGAGKVFASLDTIAVQLLRLDIKELALGKLKEGGFAIVPSDVKQSTLLTRVSSNEPEEHMPPRKFGMA